MALLLCGGLVGYLYRERLSAEDRARSVQFEDVQRYLARAYGITLAQDDLENMRADREPSVKQLPPG